MTTGRNLVYSMGECPVCSYLGDVIAVVPIPSGAMFFWCTSCGCCWNAPPVEGTIDEIRGAEDFAPTGFRPATLLEIQAVGMDRLIVASRPVDSVSTAATELFRRPQG